MAETGAGARRRGSPVVTIFLALATGLLLSNCAEEEEHLWSVRDCKSHEECVNANPLYDRCNWVCDADITYCRASCETDEDCKGRGLPSSWVFCDIPRPGEGFCNPTGFDYAADECKQDRPLIPEEASVDRGTAHES
jgi:hypothetical protein